MLDTFFFKCSWTATKLFFKSTREISLIVKPGLVANICNASGFEFEEFCCFLKAHIAQKLAGSLVNESLQLSVKL